MDADIELKINQAKFDMIEDEKLVFFSSLLSLLKIVIDPTMDTAWTDAVHMGLSPDLVRRSNPDELLGVFMHELGHIIYDHIPIAIENKEWMDQELHNIAGDHYINLQNAKDGYILPHWIKPYQDPKYTGMSTMEIYSDLESNPPSKPPPGTGMGNDIRMPEDMTAEEHKERVISIIMKADIHAKVAGQPGSTPGYVQRIIEELTHPKLPWHIILQNYVAIITREDYSMRKPNRRYFPDMYLPSLYSEKFGGCIAACDCSGSITADELNTAMCEIRYIWETIVPSWLRLMSFDVTVHFNEMFGEGDTLPSGLDLKGGGGTDVTLVLKYIREEQPELALIFTDGGFTMPNLEEIETEIIWIIKGCPGFDPPMGKVIHMEEYT